MEQNKDAGMSDYYFIKKSEILKLINRNIIPIKKKSKDDIKNDPMMIIPWVLLHREDRDEMKKIILEKAKEFWPIMAHICYQWARIIGDEKEMKEFFKPDSLLCCYWVSEHKKDREEMKENIGKNRGFKNRWIKNIWENAIK